MVSWLCCWSFVTIAITLCASLVGWVMPVSVVSSSVVGLVAVWAEHAPGSDPENDVMA